MFLMANGSYLPADQVLFIHQRLEKADDSKMASLSFVNFKDPTTALLLSLFLGGWGVDRMYIGQVGTGILKLVTCGGLGIWSIIDWFIIMNDTRKSNFNKLMTIL